MDFWAKKDPYERETEEAERLVRPSPKVKPPRHDRRREEVSPTKDPDTDGDSDTKGDADRSRNYKMIGGALLARSVAARFLQGEEVRPDSRSVVARFLRAEEDRSDFVKVRLRENPEKVVTVSPETLKREPDKYEKVEDAGDKKNDNDPKARLEWLAKRDPWFKEKIESFGDPNSALSKELQKRPKAPLNEFFQPRRLKLFPPGLNTVKDLHDALNPAGGPPAKEQKGTPEPAEKPAPAPAPEKPAPAPAPSPVEPKPEAKPKEPEKPAPKQVEPEKPADITKLVQEEVAKAISSHPPANAADIKGLGQEIAKALRDAIQEVQQAKQEKTPEPKKAPEPKREEESKPPEPKKEGPKPKPKPEEKPEKPEPPKEPKRRKPSPEEKNAALQTIIDTFPPAMAAKLLAKRIHPDDVQALVSDYHMARMREIRPADAEGFADKVSKFYETDPDKVPPPKTAKGEDGKEKPFEELTPDEQANALLAHQLRTVALSVAAYDQISQSLQTRSGVPSEVAGRVTEFMLSKNEGGEKREAQATQMARDSFFDTLSAVKEGEKEVERPEGEAEFEELSDGSIKRLLKVVRDPQAQKIAVGHFQARDYLKARDRFLDPDSKESISEHQTPAEIAKGLRKARSFFEERARLYPEGSTALDTWLIFRTRVLKHLQTLAPEKYPLIQNQMDAADNDEYDEAKSRYKKDKADYERALKKEQQSFRSDLKKHREKVRQLREKGKGKGPYRTVEPDPPKSVEDRLRDRGLMKPKVPVKPPRYDIQRKKPSDVSQESKKMLDEHLKRIARVVSRHLHG